MTNFQELGPDDSSYLNNKWNTEIIELNKEKFRLTDRLNNRVSRQAEDLVKLDEIRKDLDETNLLIGYLELQQASQEMIDKQKARVTELEEKILAVQASSRVLTKSDIAIEELELEELQMSVQLRQDRITQLEALSNAA